MISITWERRHRKDGQKNAVSIKAFDNMWVWDGIKMSRGHRSPVTGAGDTLKPSQSALASGKRANEN